MKEEFEKWLAELQTVCPICKAESRTWICDHCEDKGSIPTDKGYALLRFIHTHHNFKVG